MSRTYAQRYSRPDCALSPRAVRVHVANLLDRVPGLLGLQAAFLAVKGLLRFYVVVSLPFSEADFERFAKFIFFAGVVVLPGAQLTSPLRRSSGLATAG